MSGFDLELLEAGFSAILGARVVIVDDIQPQAAAAVGGAVDISSLPKFSIHDFFHLTYVPIPLESVNPGELFDIHVKTLTGKRVTLQVTDSFTIANIKAAIEEKEDIPARNQRLVFSGKPLGEDETVQSAGIPHGGTLFLIVLLRGGGDPEIRLPKDELAPSYDYDFTNERDDGRTYMRNKFPYQRPYGWYRYALKVLGHPKYGGDNWLGPGGIRTSTSAEEWPVSYHGTSMSSAKNIIKEGYKAGPRQLFGKGVYSSPSLTMVAKCYAQTFTHKGNTWKIALQNRVNPSSEHLKIVPASETHANADYWVSPKHDPTNDVYDVRPYGVVICKDG